MNLGSILRTAKFIGVDAIIVNKTNSPGLTPVVSKVSSGALEFIPLYGVKFVKKFLESIEGDFKIISTNVDEDAQELVLDEIKGEGEGEKKEIKGPKPGVKLTNLHDL